MTVIMSRQTECQAKLLAEFATLRERTRCSLVELAKKFKECVDAGIDMSAQGISHSAAQAYIAIAEGKLIANAVAAHLPDAHIRYLASLPKTVQEGLWERGGEVLRNGDATHLKIEDMTASEIKRLVDVLDGRGRVLSIEEQMERAVPAVIKRDHKVEVRLTYEEAVAARALAHKRGKSLETVMRELIRREAEEIAPFAPKRKTA